MIKITPDKNTNATLLWKEAFNQAIATNDKEIFFPRGTYNFYAERTTLKHCFISNNDESVKSIVFYLNGEKDFIIKGDDAEFIFHGRISPFVLENCSNIKISGISIDFSQRFNFEAKTIDCDAKSTLFKVDGDFRIEKGRLRVFDDGIDNMTGKLMCNAFNMENGEILRNGSYHLINENIVEENGMLRLPITLRSNETDFFIRHQARHTPAFVIDRSEDVKLANINIYHAEGMGVVGQNSKNILLDNVNTVPKKGKNLSVTDDGVHFSECWGDIILRNCTFIQSLDDAVNIHGMYRRMRKIGDAILLEACHFQQFGLFDGHDGDTIELLKCDTMKPYAELKVKSYFPGTRQLYCVELAEPLPAEFEDRDVARIMRPCGMNALIENCRMANNMSRGILLSGCQKGIIRNNKIHSPGHGIYLSGDANYWYESGPNKDIEIYNNIFDRCGYTSDGTNSVTVDPIIPQKCDDFCYHEKVTVRENQFILGEKNLAVSAHSLKELDFKDNTIQSENKERKDFVRYDR